MFEPIRFPRAPEADFTVGGRRYGVFVHDWRVDPPQTWIEGKLALDRRTAPAGIRPGAAPAPLRAPLAAGLRDRRAHGPAGLPSAPAGGQPPAPVAPRPRCGDDAGGALPVDTLRALLREAALACAALPGTRSCTRPCADLPGTGRHPGARRPSAWGCPSTPTATGWERGSSASASASVGARVAGRFGPPEFGTDPAPIRAVPALGTAGRCCPHVHALPGPARPPTTTPSSSAPAAPARRPPCSWPAPGTASCWSTGRGSPARSRRATSSIATARPASPAGGCWSGSWPPAVRRSRR